MNHAPTINLVFALVVIAVTFLVGIWKNVATAFALCFLPVILFTRPIIGYAIKGGLPDLRMSTAALIGLMGAMFFRFWMHPKIRWNPVDFIVLLAPVVSIASAINTENWHTGHDELLKQLFAWTAPYFFARYCFCDEEFRKNCLRALIPSAMVLGAFALFEFRMEPHGFDEALRKTGLGVAFNLQFLKRGDYYRAETSFEHPIFFGDGCVSIFCLIVMLSSTVKGGWLRPMPLLGMGAALIGLMTSISFGPLFGMAVAGGIFFLYRFVSFTRAYVVFAGIGITIIGMVYLSVYLATTPIPTRPKDGSLKDSFLVRWEIVQKCAPFAIEAGALGVGKGENEGINRPGPKGKPELDLESVDNAYMLYLCVRGAIYAGMWAAIPLLVSFRVCMALHRNKRQEFILPIAVGAGSSIGVSFAFYFVWAGWNPEPYTILWLIATAFTMSACDICFDRIADDRRAAAYRAFPAMQMGGAAPYPQLGGTQYPLPNVARAHA